MNRPRQCCESPRFCPLPARRAPPVLPPPPPAVSVVPAVTPCSVLRPCCLPVRSCQRRAAAGVTPRLAHWHRYHCMRTTHSPLLPRASHTLWRTVEGRLGTAARVRGSASAATASSQLAKLHSCARDFCSARLPAALRGASPHAHTPRQRVGALASAQDAPSGPQNSRIAQPAHALKCRSDARATARRAPPSHACTRLRMSWTAQRRHSTVCCCGQ